MNDKKLDNELLRLAKANKRIAKLKDDGKLRAIQEEMANRILEHLRLDNQKYK